MMGPHCNGAVPGLPNPARSIRYGVYIDHRL